MGERTKATQQRTPIPLTASVRIDPERVAFMWSLTPAEREAAARRGEFSLGEMCQWASLRPHEVEVLAGGDFWFMAPYMAEYDDD